MLRQAGTGPVQRVEARLAPEQGRTSIVYILELEYAEPSPAAPSRMIAKFASPQNYMVNALKATQAFQREVYFYQHSGLAVGLPVPRCYFAAYDPQTTLFLLLLEFIEHVHHIDVAKGSVDEVRMALSELAHLHARWWGNTQALIDLPLELGPDSLAEHTEKIARALLKFPDEAKGIIGPDALALLQGWCDKGQALAKLSHEGPLTLSHGSFHRQQILFPDGAGGRFCMLDWQSASRDLGAVDVARLLVSGLTPGQRHAHEASLVTLYHQALVAAGVTDYSLAQLWAHYRLGVSRVLMLHAKIFGMFNAQILMERMGNPDEPLGMWQQLFGWATQAAIEHGVLELMASLPFNEPTPAADNAPSTPTTAAQT